VGSGAVRVPPSTLFVSVGAVRAAAQA
jgi:hypothetical protein